MSMLGHIKPLNFIRNQVPINNAFDYDILQPKHVDEVIDVFTHTFCGAEPMTHYLNMQYDTYRDFARVVTESAVKDGFSVVALHKGRVVACALNEDLADPRPIPTDFDPNFKYILALLDKLGEKFFPGKQFFKNEIAHLFITAVAKEYRQLGLSVQVNFHAMDVAAHRGFKQMYSELTNYINENGIMHHMKNKKRLIGSCTYDEFRMDGVKPFANLSGCAHAYLWEISGDPMLRYMENDKEACTEL